MKEKLAEKLKRKDILLLDCAMGTNLQKAGLKSGEECGEFWNADSNRDKVLQLHRSCVESGSDIIITNTFGANPIKLAHYEASERVEELNREGAKLACEAAGDEALVAGDIGPTGDILEHWGGTRSREEIRTGYERQVTGLVEGGVNLIILETFMDVEELLLAFEAARKLSELPVIASMTFEAGPNGMRTMWGLAPEQVTQKLEQAGVDAVGANCGMGTRDMLRVASKMVKATSLPVAAQPNAGAPEMRNGETFYSETAEQMAAVAGEFKAAGVKILGGCCGTTPEYIAAVKSRLGL